MPSITVTMDMREWTWEAQHWSTVSQWTPLKRKLWSAVKRRSRALRSEIKTRMPVDTGRARGSWGAKGKAAGGTGKEDFSLMGVWEEDEEGLALTQGSFVPYIVYLEQGHSSQAPAGFISQSAEMAVAELAEDCGEVLYYHCSGKNAPAYEGRSEGPGFGGDE